MALNGIQREILGGTLRYPLAEIKEFKFPENGEEITFEGGRIDDAKALKAFQLIIADEISSLEQANLHKWDVYHEVMGIRNMLAHPCPQNRNASTPGVILYLTNNISPERRAALLSRENVNSIEEYMDGHAVYTLTNNYTPEDFQREPLGIFGISMQNESPSEANPHPHPATKQDVTDFIRAEVAKRINVMQAKGIQPVEIETSPLMYALASSDVLLLMRDHNVTFEQASTWFSQSPLKLATIATPSIRRSMRDLGMPIQDISERFDEDRASVLSIALFQYNEENGEMSVNPETMEHLRQVHVGGFNVPAPGNRIGTSSSGQGQGRG